jgi:hypothetical protein
MHFSLSVGDRRKFAHYAFQKHSANTYIHYLNALYRLESALCIEGSKLKCGEFLSLYTTQ